ncbi:dihydrolipoyl dehydrogenase family protein [Cryobacterium melibiosiphilum]|uniref:dihydrolipoyl dehydrogenase family protein n=1 Tax=Cryobacterium melibiosiphilum TaxID=995039 RepID=UPI001F3C52DB|nr:NAD(P)/FAD-dependent oxidoreductase [Cryobacterium melibiosiphilum]
MPEQTVPEQTVPEHPDHFDVIVIGAGPAGTAAALRAAELGASVAVLEADRLGGTCVNTGCVPTRVLAKAARLMREIRTAETYGLEVTVHPVDWPATVAHVEQTVERVRSIKREAERFAAAGITLVLEGRARFTDSATVLLDSGRILTADAFIICVGGHSRRLPIPGADLAVVPEHVLGLPAIPRRLAVIGGGNTGAQLVTVFTSFGSAVTLLDVAPRLLVNSDAAVSDAVAQAFVDQGVTVHLGIGGIERLVREADASLTLHFAAAGRALAASFDAVIMATGWPADVLDLGLPEAGVDTARSSVVVDAFFRSSVPHIFAVGDANGRDMLVQAAQFEGESAAENAVLHVNRRTPPHLLPSGGFTDPDYAGVGLTEEQARLGDIRCRVVLVPYSQLDRAVIDDRERGFLKLIADRRGEFLLGAHATGENAVEVIQSVTTAMAAGVDLATLAQVRFAYPTYSAIIGIAARELIAGLRA